MESNKYQTEQEKFWNSTFGNEYTQRNTVQKLLHKNIALFSQILSKAANLLRLEKSITVFQQSMLDFSPKQTYDFVLTKTVLIHINPDLLPTAYDIMYRSCKKYLCIAEYYNPTPVKVTYRNHKERLFKRDFAGEILDRFPDMRLVDYGFVYHKDKLFPQDDINWFLLEKK